MTKTAPDHGLQALLQSQLAELQARRHGFSLRAFSRRLGVPAPVLSQVLNGKRPVTRALATALCEGLGLSPEETRSLALRYPDTRRGRPAGNAVTESRAQRREPVLPVLYVQLADDEFHVIADWYYFAILSLAETESFNSDPAWIARRLGILPAQAERAVERLVRLSLLKRKGTRLSPTGKAFTTATDVPSVALRKHHLQGLELAERALLGLPVEKREFAASTFAGDPGRLPLAKRQLRELRRKVVKTMEKGRKREVYRLSVQLIPLSRKENP